MCDKEWRIFVEELSDVAYARMSSLLQAFADTGEEDLPRQAFRCLSPDPADPTGVTVGAFEACGVVIYGHVAKIGSRPAFFVKMITIDEPDQPPKRPKAKKSDDRQRRLPFSREDGSD